MIVKYLIEEEFIVISFHSKVISRKLDLSSMNKTREDSDHYCQAKFCPICPLSRNLRTCRRALVADKPFSVKSLLFLRSASLRRAEKRPGLAVKSCRRIFL